MRLPEADRALMDRLQRWFERHEMGEVVDLRRIAETMLGEATDSPTDLVVALYTMVQRGRLASLYRVELGGAILKEDYDQPTDVPDHLDDALVVPCYRRLS